MGKSAESVRNRKRHDLRACITYGNKLTGSNVILKELETIPGFINDGYNFHNMRCVNSIVFMAESEKNLLDILLEKNEKKGLSTARKRDVL